MVVFWVALIGIIIMCAGAVSSINIMIKHK